MGCSRDVQCYSLNCTQLECKNETAPPAPPVSYCSSEVTATANKCPFVSCVASTECMSNRCLFRTSN